MVKERKRKREVEMILLKLPDDMLLAITSLISRRDACRSELVSKRFRKVFHSNVVWENFLPPGYEGLIAQADAIPEAIRIPEEIRSAKKELYFYLCENPIRIGNGNMSFSIDRESGKKCFMVGARGLSIALGDIPECWDWIPRPESRFPQVAVLINLLTNVWWLHIVARVETRILSLHTTYEAYFVFKLEHHHNFQNRPVRLCVDFEGREDGEVLNVFLDLQGNDRGDGWREIKMGEFFNEDGEDGSVLCCLTEDDDNHIKFGLIVEGIELRPKHV